eukprot:1022288_1
MSSLLRLFIWIHTIQCITSHWLDLAALPTSDSGMAVGSHVASRSIYLLGGNVGQTTLTKYSIDFNTFSTIEPTPLTSPLNSNSQFWTQQDDIVYMMSTLTSLAAFDLATLTYSESLTFVPQHPGPYPCLASSMDYLYVTGGSSQPDVLQVFQISTGQWTQPINRMSAGRYYHSCVVHQSWLYVFAGYGEYASWLTSTERINTSEITRRLWQNSATLSHATVNSRAISCGNQLFVLGGFNTQGTLNTAQLINPLAQTTSVQYMPYAVEGMGSVCFEQDVYVFGGDRAFYYTDHALTYDTQNPTSLTFLPSVTPSELPSHTPSDNPTTPPSSGSTEHPSEVPTTDRTVNPTTLNPSPTVDVPALDSNDAMSAVFVSAIVIALIVFVIYILRKCYLRRKMKWIEEGMKTSQATLTKQVVVIAVNNKSQEEDISENEEDSNQSNDSLYDKPQNDGETTFDHEQVEGVKDVKVDPVDIEKNETELRQEEKSSSCNSDDIYEGNEPSISNSNRIPGVSTQHTDH